MLEVLRTIPDVLSSVSFTKFKCSLHPTGPMLNIPEIFSEALASPAYMVAMPMQTLQLNSKSELNYASSKPLA